MKKINRLKLKARSNNWDVVGHAGLQFCGNIMPRFGLETGSDYIMSIRITPKNKTHRKVAMSLSCAGFWQWQCDAVPLAEGSSHERFFNRDLEVKELMRQFVEPNKREVNLWIKFRKIS